MNLPLCDKESIAHFGRDGNRNVPVFLCLLYRCRERNKNFTKKDEISLLFLVKLVYDCNMTNVLG
ncbi:hypothetical protein BRYFOR_07427 [Marvinbryantia formatexigens DSM 14469]|uniref:Uncharacterized protein n=1 Tax=Marvinbryantia formatexigens DSM 14469 TaxID=478749 RepID=C6LFM4_9FIRM|nr:hypothetical protein BRYFOR_07427 [Marvinbryantia formatexigens DSM 14469]